MRHSTQYQLAGPKTFRRGSRKILKKWGGNVQNLEAGLRSIFIPDGFSVSLTEKCKHWIDTGEIHQFTEEELVKLRVMLQCDQAGAEALIVAYDSEPGDYRKLFIHQISPHVYLGLKLFPEVWKEKVSEHNLTVTKDDIEILNVTPIDRLKHHPAWKDTASLIKLSDKWETSQRYYYFAKQTGHSGNYDIQAPKFVFNVLEKSGGKVVIPLPEGKRFLETYRGIFPEIPERNERIKRQVQQTGVLFNMLGFPYQITNYNIQEHGYKEFYAWGPQSTVGEITRIAFCDLQEYIEVEKKPYDILEDNHDSYLVQCPILNEYLTDCAEKMKKFMNQELTSPIDGTVFHMRSEINVGFNWGPYNKDTNPLGLQELKWLKL